VKHWFTGSWKPGVQGRVGAPWEDSAEQDCHVEVCCTVTRLLHELGKPEPHPRARVKHWFTGSWKPGARRVVGAPREETAERYKYCTVTRLLYQAREA